MAKEKKFVVRDHDKERAWLLRLGKGNIFVGVQNLIQEQQEKLAEKIDKKKGR